MGRKPARFTDDNFVRRLWQERFSNLTFPEDFIHLWTDISSALVIGAFKDAETFLRRFPDKTAMDIAKLISATVRRGLLMRTGKMQRNHTVNAVEFCGLWKQFFPNRELPTFSLKYWVDSRRLMPEALAAFEAVSKINQGKTAEDIAKLISKHMSKSAMAREAQQLTSCC